MRDYVEISGNTVAGAFAFGGLVVFDPSVPGRCTLLNNELRVDEHSSIRHCSKCSVNASPCVSDPADPTARCVP